MELGDFIKVNCKVIIYEVKLCLWLITGHNMKAYGGVEV
jgi:hypothetical protein